MADASETATKSVDLISVRRVAASDIREVQGSGLFFPTKATEPTLLLVAENGSRHAIKLTGSDRYNHFPIRLNTPCAGLFVPEVEIRVELSSRADASGLSEKPGTLILSGDSLSLVSGLVGDKWGDPSPFELPFTVTAGSDATRIAFARWSIGITQNDAYVSLWEPEQP